MTKTGLKRTLKKDIFIDIDLAPCKTGCQVTITGNGSHTFPDILTFEQALDCATFMQERLGLPSDHIRYKVLVLDIDFERCLLNKDQILYKPQSVKIPRVNGVTQKGNNIH